MNNLTLPTFFSKNPVIDSAIREALKYLSGLLSLLLVAYMKKNGYDDNTLIMGIPTAMLAALSSFVSLGFAVWSVINKKHTVTAMVDHTTAAAVTGVVPAGVKALANAAQRAAISDAGK